MFSQIKRSINSKELDIKFIIITLWESILILRWIITTFQKVVCFIQFLWVWYNIFASFFLLDVMFSTCSFICICLFCRITSFNRFLRLFTFAAEPRIHWKSAAGKVGLLYLGSVIWCVRPVDSSTWEENIGEAFISFITWSFTSSNISEMCLWIVSLERDIHLTFASQASPRSNFAVFNKQGLTCVSPIV